MSYEVIKTFKIDLKDLTISGTYYCSNVTDYNGKRIIEDFEQRFDTLEQLEDKLLVWAKCSLGGSAKFYPSSSFAKKVEWLVENGHVSDEGIYSSGIKDSQEVREVLTGKKKIKFKKYIYIVKSDKSLNGYNMVLKQTRTGIRLTPIGKYRELLTTEEIMERSKGERVLSILRKQQMEFIQKHHSEWLENNRAELIAL